MTRSYTTTTKECKICGFMSMKLRSHVRRRHSLDFEMYLLRYIHNNSIPKCRCGCGEDVNFSKKQQKYKKFIDGHANVGRKNTPEQCLFISQQTKKAMAPFVARRILERPEIVKKRGKHCIDCPICKNKTVLRNCVLLIEHLKTEHGFESEESAYVSIVLSNEKPKCKCGCGQSPTFIDWRGGFKDFVHAHNSLGVKKTAEQKQVHSDFMIDRWKNDENFKQRISEAKRLPLGEALSRFDAAQTSLKMNVDELDYHGIWADNVAFSCDSCGMLITTSIALAINGCPNCEKGKISRGQREIASFVKSLGFTITLNNQSVINPLELDILVEEKKLAIEYHGLYWHAIGLGAPIGHWPGYHQKKTDKCNENGIKLIHVFEDEWEDKRNIVESMIMHRLGASPSVVNARDCVVEELDSHSSIDFFNKNHIDGAARSKITMCLINDGTVVAALSLRQPKTAVWREKNLLEIARACTLIKTSVRGWLGKLLSHCKNYAIANGFMGIMSYADERHGGDMFAYQLSGMQRETTSESSRFWWTDGHRRLNRFAIKADRENGLTEKEVAKMSGFGKIYGCKNRLYIVKY